MSSASEQRLTRAVVDIAANLHRIARVLEAMNTNIVLGTQALQKLSDAMSEDVNLDELKSQVETLQQIRADIKDEPVTHICGGPDQCVVCREGESDGIR